MFFYSLVRMVYFHQFAGKGELSLSHCPNIPVAEGLFFALRSCRWEALEEICHLSLSLEVSMKTSGAEKVAATTLDICA